MIPFEEREQGKKDVLWRYSGNPVITRDAVPGCNSIFNSAVVPFEGGFAGVFRCDSAARVQELHAGFSKDGINWEINPEPISFVCEEEEIGKFILGYDPRVCYIGDRYYLTWCNAYEYMPTVGVAYTFDFRTFYQMENAFLPFNRNGVLFPEKIGGAYYMLSRPSDNGHTPFGDIFLSQSPDMVHWGKHRLVMRAGTDAGKSQWQSTKVGAGPIPIRTQEGWLLIYHGVLNSCNGFVYSMGAAILDLEKPWVVKYRSAPYLLNPRELYECVGDVPNVVFPCAALTEGNRVAIYYGAADTVTGLAFGYLDEILNFVKENSL